MNKYLLILSLFFLPLCTSADELPTLREVSNMSFDDMNGRHWSQADLKGKVSIVNFFFASCKNVCPVMNKRLKNSTSKFLNDPRFQVLSVTVDPENDSAESLKEYAKYLGSNPYWYFLRSPIKNVEEFLVKGLGIGSPDDITLHTTRLTLIDTKARVRAYVSSSDSDDMEELSEEIETLLTEAK
jgi:protein SCO1/2